MKSAMKSVHLGSFGQWLAVQAVRPIGVAGLAALLETAILRSRGRSSLAELDHRLLSDIGVSRAEALRESGKPFWR